MRSTFLLLPLSIFVASTYAVSVPVLNSKHRLARGIPQIKAEIPDPIVVDTRSVQAELESPVGVRE